MRFMLFDRWGNPLGDIQSVIDAKRTRGTDGTDTLDITVIGEINKDERIVFRDSMGRWAEYLCRYPETERSSGRPITTAYCSGSVCELSKVYIEDRRNRSATAEACLSKALDGTKWKVGTVQAGLTTHQADLAFYHEFVSDALQDICDTFGLELQTRIEVDGSTVKARYIDLLEQRGDPESTRRFEYRKDLPAIKRTVDSDNVITRLWCWGKGVEQTDGNGEATGGYSRKIGIGDVNDGKPYIDADASTLAQWGIAGPDGKTMPSEGVYENGDIDDPAKLLAAGKAYLAKTCKPSVSYTATVAALGRAGFDPEGVDVGDSVQIIDSAFTPTLRLEGRVLKIEEDLIGILADTTLTLGNITQSYTQRMAAQKQQLDKLINSSGAWSDAAGGKGVYIADLIDRINQIMNETGGYVYQTPNQGIYVYDKPIDQDPTQVIQIGGGYWRCASSRKANGDWNWRSLANGKGLFADAIYTGLLSDAAGYNSWNLDTGDFKLSARTTVGGKTVDAIAGDSSAAALAEAKKYTDQMKRESDQTDLDNLAAAKDYAQSKADEARKGALASASTDATNKANAALEAAKKAAQAYVDALDESLGQKNVFDRLTNYGKIQGIYLSGGLLYLNATYMRTGVLDAALVKAGRLTDKKGLNFWDMDTGEFSLSASSTVGGNKASSLATQTQAQKLATNAQTAAKAYADSVGTSTLNSARNDATTKADTALSGAKTYAETIMAYGSNLVRNPNGNPDHDLDKLGASKLTKTMPAAHPEGITSAIRLGNVRDTYFGWSFDSFRGHTFRLSGWAYRKAGNVTSSFGIHWMDASGSNHWQAMAEAAATASGWTYVSGSYTVPSNAKTARLWMQVDRDTTTASDADWYWTGLQCTDETAARSYVDTFEGELTQTYIFNKLTNNGQKQGLYLSNGLLYINATYIKAGIITGGKSYINLDTGAIYLSGGTFEGGTYRTNNSTHTLSISGGVIRGYNGSTTYGTIDFASTNGNGRQSGMTIAADTLAEQCRSAVFCYSSKTGWQVGMNDTGLTFVPAKIWSNNGIINWMIGRQTQRFCHGRAYGFSTTSAG